MIKVRFFAAHRFVFLACFLLLGSVKAYGTLKIDITNGNAEPLPIALVVQSAKGSPEEQFVSGISEVITNNLIRSGLFSIVDKNAHIDASLVQGALPSFNYWRQIRADALVTLKGEMVGDGTIRIEFRLWDTVREQQIRGKYYFASYDFWRRIAHIISDNIYTRLTGESGYFDTSIVYISESGSNKKKITRLAIMDQDGENHRFLSDGKDLVLGPRFSPNDQRIVYLNYFNKMPRAYLFNIETGVQELIGEFSGMTISPRFSPDGEKIILAADMKKKGRKGGSFEIYAMNLETRVMKRLTNNSWMDISPSYSPDGKKIVYVSNKPGCPQLYVMDANGKNSKRISYHTKNGTKLRCGALYTTPVWSPRGDLIAFTKQYDGLFYVGVMAVDGSSERLLDHVKMPDNFHVEGPAWSPNGRQLLFYRKNPVASDGSGGESRIYAIDISGRSFRHVITPLEGSDPAWSPLKSIKEVQ